MFDEATLARLGWDRAFVTVLDEAPAEESIAVIAHDAGAPPDDGWHATRIQAEPDTGKGKTGDAEACARRDGWIYVLGSQFGQKQGPLAARRSWVARVREADLPGGLEGSPVPLQVARLRFGLHRAINDALAASGIELIELGPLARERYIDGTIARGAAGAKSWAGRVTSADHPVNVEGAEFRGDGRLLLGLRYPVTAAGQPILVELPEIEPLFEDPDATPRCGAAWVIENVGSPEAPAGVRALHTDSRDRFEAVVGDLDAAGKGATILEDHPEGGRAHSLHVRFELPLSAAGGPVRAEVVHDFGDVRRVEGVAIDPDGHAHFVIDEEGRVALRTLLVEDA